MRRRLSSSILLTLAAGAILALPARAAAVGLVVEEPAGVARRSWPVTSGVSFARGALKDAAGVKLTAGGRELPLQAEILARWPGGSVRWLLLDFQVDLGAGQKLPLRLDYGRGVRRSAVKDPVRVVTVPGAATAVAGPLKMAVSERKPDPLGSIWLDSDGNGVFSGRERLTAGTSSGFVVTDEAGREYRSDAARAKMTVEQSGPVRACLRVEGDHLADDGARMFRYVARLHAYRGKPYVRVFYTFINDRPDALIARVKSVRVDLGLTERGPGGAKSAGKCFLGGGEGRAIERRGGARLLQPEDGEFLIDGRPAGRRAAGWMALSTPGASVCAAVRHFWQNWPKSLSADGPVLSVGLCPPFEKGRYDGKPLDEDNRLYYWLHDGLYGLKVGCAKTHEVWLAFRKGPVSGPQAESFGRSACEPLVATCDPTHMCSTAALGEMPPADAKKFAGYDGRVEAALRSHYERRENNREYGMLNFGDWFGERGVNWGNLEYDLQHGLLLQYARTGDRRYFARAEEAARHHIDVDVLHAVNTHVKNPWGPAPKPGEVWLHCLGHTGGYYEYGKVKLPVSKTYFMGHSRNWGHVWVGGDLEYYLFTGDRRALEVGLMVADRMVENCPTRYGTHIRAQGWPMIMLLHAYDVTGDQKYVRAAGVLWKVLKDNLDPQKGWVVQLAGDHCKHGDRRCRGNVPFMEGLMLAALSRYHRVTKDPEVLKAITVGVDQMIRECWIEEEDLFRYTACPLSPHWAGLNMLCVEAMAYEVEKTGNAEHRRILREALKRAITDGMSGFGKNFAQRIHFAPHALGALEGE